MIHIYICMYDIYIHQHTQQPIRPLTQPHPGPHPSENNRTLPPAIHVHIDPLKTTIVLLLRVEAVTRDGALRQSPRFGDADASQNRGRWATEKANDTNDTTILYICIIHMTHDTLAQNIHGIPILTMR